MWNFITKMSHYMTKNAHPSMFAAPSPMGIAHTYRMG